MMIKKYDEFITEANSTIIDANDVNNTTTVFVKSNSHRSYDKLNKMLGSDNVVYWASITKPHIMEIKKTDFDQISNIKGITLHKSKVNVEDYRTALGGDMSKHNNQIKWSHLSKLKYTDD